MTASRPSLLISATFVLIAALIVAVAISPVLGLATQVIA